MGLNIFGHGILCLVLLGGNASPVAAQDTQSPARNGETRGAWMLAGIDAGIGERWRTSVRLGYLSELDTRVSIVDVTFVAVDALHVLLGHVYLDPSALDSAATSVVRAGVSWAPLRGRVTLDNRFLIERRSTRMSLSIRGRNRTRLSWSSGGRVRLVVFGSIETFVAEGVGFAEHRYQVGASRRIGRAAAEVYWVRRGTRTGLASNSLGLTAFWRIGTA